jgi:hypothetical protein
MIAAVGVLAALGATAGARALAQDPPPDPARERQQLKDARALWASQHVRSYRYRLRLSCFCPQEVRGPVTIVVRNGRPRGTSGFHKQLDTVRELFTKISRALKDEKAGDVSARYDRRRGFPREASIDQIKLAIDDELSFTVDRFRVLR